MAIEDILFAQLQWEENDNPNCNGDYSKGYKRTANQYIYSNAASSKRIINMYYYEQKPASMSDCDWMKLKICSVEQKRPLPESLHISIKAAACCYFYLLLTSGRAGGIQIIYKSWRTTIEPLSPRYHLWARSCCFLDPPAPPEAHYN